MFKHFFIVGAQRSGTSYLWHLLDKHPEIEMAKPLRPEPKYFLVDSLYSHGIAHYERHYFSGASGAWLRGEKSTSYIESEKAAQRIAQTFPKARILFLLRNPIERAISNYWFSVDNGFEHLAMEQAFFQEEQRLLDYDERKVSVSPFAYLTRGRYGDYIEMYERHFPSVQMKILLLEQLTGSASALRSLYAFLDVSPEFLPEGLDQRFNRGHKLDEPLTPELASYLAGYFTEANSALNERYGLDLTEWALPEGS